MAEDFKEHHGSSRPYEIHAAPLGSSRKNGACRVADKGGRGIYYFRGCAANYQNVPLILLTFLSLISTCFAAYLPNSDWTLEEGLTMVALGLSMGVDGEALSCPSSPITTPVSLRMVCYAAFFYAFVLVMLVVWLLWKRASWAFYLMRQARKASASINSQNLATSNGITKSDSEESINNTEPERSYMCVSPILEHGGMFLQEYGYQHSLMGCFVYALVIASIALSVLFPFLVAFAANSVTPSHWVTQFIPSFLYKNIAGIAQESGIAGASTGLYEKSITASPQCIKLRVYIFAVCFMWCLAWMVVVHIWRHRITWLSLTPACLSESTYLLVDRRLQKILLLPQKRDKTAQNPSSTTSWGGLQILSKRKDLGELPVTSTFAKVENLPNSRGRFAESSRIRLVYNPAKEYFLPTAAVFEEKARVAAEKICGVMEDLEIHGLRSDGSRGTFLETLQNVLVPPEEVVHRQDVTGKIGLGWSIRPISTLLVASFLQDEFYLVTLMALWYQAFSINNLQAIILLTLPIFELAFGVYSMRKGEQQTLGIMQREQAVLELRKMLCVRLKREADGFPHITEDQKNKGKSFSIVLKRTRASDIVPGDIVLLQPGDEVPCDLLLVHGSVSLDESHLTGEADPVVKVPIRQGTRLEKVENFDTDSDPARIAEDEVLDPSSVTGNAVGCIYAGSIIVHTSCRSDIATTMFNEDSVLPAEAEGEVQSEREIAYPLEFLLEDECCWGIAVRTHGETMRGQLIRQLHLPTIMRFKYHAQFPYVLLIVTLFAFALIAIQTAFTSSLVDTFRFAVEKILRMLPLYIPALWGICASLNAKRLSKWPSRSNTLSHPQTYQAMAVLPGLLPLAAKTRVVCFDKTGTLTQTTLSLLGAHEVTDDVFGKLVLYNPEDEAGLMDSVHVECSGEGNLPMKKTVQSLVGEVSPMMLQCLACCHSLHFTAHGMAAWARKRQAAYANKYVFRAEELRRISEMSPHVSDDDIEGVDLEKQALICSGFNMVEIASASLEKKERPTLTRATTVWAAEMQKLRRTRLLIVPRKECHEPEQQQMLEIVKTYCFDHATGMKSVIARECQDTAGCQGQKGYVFCKGRFEDIERACWSFSKPPDFVECARKYAKDGTYVVGAAYRELSPEELSVLDTQGGNIPRAQGESNLRCLGLILFRNELRTDTKDTIDELSQGGIRCVMLTGDNPYTSTAVARRAGMICSHPKSQGVVSRYNSLALDTLIVPKLVTPVLLGNAVLGTHEVNLPGKAQMHGVRWTDVETTEEVEPWRVYYTDEFKELVVTMAATKILMKEPDAEFLRAEEADGDIEDPWRRTSRQEALREHAERQTLLPHATDWKSETPSLFDRIFFRIRIFARMSPMGKKLVVLHFQRRGLITSMVGDGSNDSLAIRQADVGVEIGQVQSAPFSAPFAIFPTCKRHHPLDSVQRNVGKDGVRGVVDIVRIGRCSLSTAMAIYRLHISYGLLSATASLLVVTAQYTGMNSIAVLFLDVVVLLGLSAAMLFSSPVNGPLAKKSPSSSPFGAATVVSVLSLVSVDLGALALLLYLFYGPGGFPPPCSWVRSRMLAAMEKQTDKRESAIATPIIKREQMLHKEEAKLKEEEKRVHAMKNALEQKAKELSQQEHILKTQSAVLVDKSPPVVPSKNVNSLLNHQIAMKPFEQPPVSYLSKPNSDGGVPLAWIPSHLKQQTYPSLDLKLPQFGRLHAFFEGSAIAREPDAFRHAMFRQSADAPSTPWAPQSFLQGISSPYSEGVNNAGVMCSTDGHAEASLIFVWTGICTLHAAMLFISGNVFRKPAWKNRVLLPFSVLLMVFFVSIMFVPPSSMSCIFNVNCTTTAAMNFRNNPLYSVLSYIAGESAASTLHDATAGRPALDSKTGKATVQIDSTNKMGAMVSQGHLPPLPETKQFMENAAEYMKHMQQSVRHLWTEEEATKLAKWFSHVLLYVLGILCFFNTIMQLVCLHKNELSEWWRKPHRGESIPL